MILNKKRLFLYSSILLLILVGVYFTDAFGAITRGPSRVTTSSTGAFSLNGVNYTELANWTRGGITENINFTLVLRNAAGLNGTSNINITLPTSFSFSAGMLTNNVGATNASTQSATNPYPNITFSNTSSEFRVVTVDGNYSAGLTVNVFFNITAASGVEATRNWTVMVRDNGTGRAADSGFGVLTGVDGLAPTISGHNVTEGSNTYTSFTGTKYLRYDTTTGANITINLTATDYNMDRVLLIFNSTGGSLNLTEIGEFNQNLSEGKVSQDGKNNSINGLITEVGSSGNKANLTSLITRSDVTLASAPGYLFSFNISNFTWGLGASDGTAFRYVFVVYDLLNNTNMINNSDAEFVIARDVNNPSVTLTEPLDTSIGVFDPIKYKCDGSDTSGLASCTTTLTKPASGTVTKTGCGTEHTFTTTDTNEAGSYTVECKNKDNIGRVNSKSATFTTSAAGGGVSGGGGVGGGGGGSAEEAIEVPTGVTGDLGTLTTTNVYTSISKDGSVSFVVAGSYHTAKVLDVTEDSATIEVSSTPSQFTLNVGESQDVDVDDNGVNDLVVTLDSITNGKADLVFKSTPEAAPPAEEVPGVIPPTEEVGPSLTWLWVVLVIVVVVLLIWYFSRRKR